MILQHHRFDPVFTLRHLDIRAFLTMFILAF